MQCLSNAAICVTLCLPRAAIPMFCASIHVKATQRIEFCQKALDRPVVAMSRDMILHTCITINKTSKCLSVKCIKIVKCGSSYFTFSVHTVHAQELFLSILCINTGITNKCILCTFISNTDITSLSHKMLSLEMKFELIQYSPW